MKFTVESLMALNADEMKADPQTDVIVDAIAEQYHAEQEPALKKTLDKKYKELAKARNESLGRKYFYESIQTVEKNNSTKAPEPKKKDAPKDESASTEGAGNQEGQLLDGAGESASNTVSEPKTPAPARVKITDEIVERVIEGIGEGLKPKEIAALKLPGIDGGEERSMDITADNVYDIIHLRGRFGQKPEWVASVAEAKEKGAAAAKKKAEDAKAAKAAKPANSAPETATAQPEAANQATATEATLPEATVAENTAEAGFDTTGF